MERVLAVFQRNLIGLTEPCHQEAHGGAMLLLLQEGGDNESKGLGSVKTFEAIAPEAKVGAFAALVPFGQSGGDVFGRCRGFGALQVWNLLHRRGSELVPPGGQPPHSLD